MGALNINPRDLLTTREILDPAAVVRWIQRNVPCVAGRVDAEWTDAIIKSLDRQNVSEHVIVQAFKLALIHHYYFGDIEFLRAFGKLGWQYKPAPLPADYVAPPSMGPAEPMTEEYILKVAAYHEEQYVLAVRTNDYRAQARMLNSLRNFLRNALASSMLGRKPREAAELNRVRDQVRQRAATVTSDADRLERAGVQNPTEFDVRNRIAPMRRPTPGGSRTRR